MERRLKIASGLLVFMMAFSTFGIFSPITPATAYTPAVTINSVNVTGTSLATITWTTYSLYQDSGHYSIVHHSKLYYQFAPDGVNFGPSTFIADVPTNTYTNTYHIWSYDYSMSTYGTYKFEVTAWGEYYWSPVQLPDTLLGYEWSSGVLYSAPLSASISPTSVALDAGMSQVFTSTVSGGTPPYTYQWYLNCAAVSGATSATWTFTPSSADYYAVYVIVKDSLGITAYSNNAAVTPPPPPAVVIDSVSASSKLRLATLCWTTNSWQDSYGNYAYVWYSKIYYEHSSDNVNWGSMVLITDKSTPTGISYMSSTGSASWSIPFLMPAPGYYRFVVIPHGQSYQEGVYFPDTNLGYAESGSVLGGDSYVAITSVSAAGNLAIINWTTCSTEAPDNSSFVSVQSTMIYYSFAQDGVNFGAWNYNGDFGTGTNFNSLANWTHIFVMTTYGAYKFRVDVCGARSSGGFTETGYIGSDTSVAIAGGSSWSYAKPSPNTPNCPIGQVLGNESSNDLAAVAVVCYISDYNGYYDPCTNTNLGCGDLFLHIAVDAGFFQQAGTAPYYIKEVTIQIFETGHTDQTQVWTYNQAASDSFATQSTFVPLSDAAKVAVYVVGEVIIFCSFAILGPVGDLIGLFVTGIHSLATLYGPESPHPHPHIGPNDNTGTYIEYDGHANDTASGGNPPTLAGNAYEDAIWRVGNAYSSPSGIKIKVHVTFGSGTPCPDLDTGLSLNYDSSAPALPAVTTPPTTTISLSGTKGPNGWYTSDVTATLSAEDGADGVANTMYSFDDVNWFTYTRPFTVSNEGTTTVYYYSTDNVGNVETTKTAAIMIDKTPPTTTINLSGTQGLNGWYTSNVAVTLASTDATSGVTSTMYSFDDVNWQTYTGPFTVSAEGSNTIYYRSIDNAGNTEPTDSISIKIDTAPPTTSITIGSHYTDGSGNIYVTSATQFTLSAIDSASAVANTYYSINGGQYNIYPGAFHLTGADGVYSISYYSTDAAGNQEVAGSATVTALLTWTGMTNPSGHNYNFYSIPTSYGVGGHIDTAGFLGDSGFNFFGYTLATYTASSDGAIRIRGYFRQFDTFNSSYAPGHRLTTIYVMYSNNLNTIVKSVNILDYTDGTNWKYRDVVISGLNPNSAIVIGIGRSDTWTTDYSLTAEWAGVQVGTATLSWTGVTSPAGHFIHSNTIAPSYGPGWHVDTSGSRDSGYQFYAYASPTFTVGADGKVTIQGWFKQSDTLSSSQQRSGRAEYAYLVNPNSPSTIIKSTQVLTYSDGTGWVQKTVTFTGLTPGTTFKVAFGRTDSWSTDYKLTAEWAGVSIITSGVSN